MLAARTFAALTAKRAHMLRARCWHAVRICLHVLGWQLFLLALTAALVLCGQRMRCMLAVVFPSCRLSAAQQQCGLTWQLLS